MNDNEYIEKLEQNRLGRIEEAIAMLKEKSAYHQTAISDFSLGTERINNTISRIIGLQNEHAIKLKEMEAISIVSRHWKFIVFTVLAIIVISLSIHSSLKEVIGWII